jgi:hypothetical protein
VTLPLRRLVRLYAPVPEHELPMRSALLGMPRFRPALGWGDRVLFVLALAGAVALGRRGPGSPERRALFILAGAVGVRSAFYSYAVPLGVTSRYLVEVFPFLLVAGGLGAGAAARALRGLVRSGRPAVAGP